MCFRRLCRRRDQKKVEEECCPVEQNIAPKEQNIATLEQNTILLEQNTVSLEQNIEPLTQTETSVETKLDLEQKYVEEFDCPDSSSDSVSDSVSSVSNSEDQSFVAREPCYISPPFENMCIRFNSCPSEELCVTCGFCTVKEFLQHIQVPEDATHMIVSFTVSNTQYSIPFSLDKKYEDESFPCEDSDILVAYDPHTDLPVEVSMLHMPYMNGKLISEDMTCEMSSYAWNEFKTGFHTYRPHAFSFLADLSTDPDAIIQAKYTDGRCVCMSLSTFELFHISL